MKALFLYVLLFPFLVTARGRGSTGGFSGLTSDWNATGAEQATLAFSIIYCIVAIGQFVTLLKRVKILPPSTRKPFIVLLFLTANLFLFHLLSAITVRMRDTIPNLSSISLESFLEFSIAWDVALRPIVVLWIFWIRAHLLRQATGKTFSVVAINFWKRTLDCSIAAILFLLSLTHLGIYANFNNRFAGTYNSSTPTETAILNYVRAVNGFSYTIAAFLILFYIDVLVTAISVYRIFKQKLARDAVSNIILKGVVTVFMAHAIFVLIITIITSLIFVDFYLGEFLGVFLVGAFRIIVTAILTYVITMPGAHWTITPTTAAPMYSPSVTTPGTQYATSWQSPVVQPVAHTPPVASIPPVPTSTYQPPPGPPPSWKPEV